MFVQAQIKENIEAPRQWRQLFAKIEAFVYNIAVSWGNAECIRSIITGEKYVNIMYRNNNSLVHISGAAQQFTLLLEPLKKR